MTGRIRLLAWIYLVMCGVSLTVGIVVVIGLLLSRDPQRDSALLFVGPVFLAMGVLFFLPGLIGGLGLLRGKAWARAIIIILSILILLLFPVGTALGGFGLAATRPGSRRSFLVGAVFALILGGGAGWAIARTQGTDAFGLNAAGSRARDRA